MLFCSARGCWFGVAKDAFVVTLAKFNTLGVGGNVKNSLLAFVRESRTLEKVGLHGREIIELRILCQHPPNLPVSFSISQKVHFYQILCRRSRSACLCSRTPENQ